VNETTSDDSDVLKSFGNALWLIAARRQNDDSALDNEWLWGEIRQLRVEGSDPTKYLESVGRLVGALIEVSSFFLTGWARSSGEDPEALIALTRRICEEQYTDHGSNSESGSLRSQECPG
jgi:D-Tyr-tRNAtyr deacylase